MDQDSRNAWSHGHAGQEAQRGFRQRAERELVCFCWSPRNPWRSVACGSMSPISASSSYGILPGHAVPKYPPFYKDTSQIRLGSTIMTSFLLHDICQDLHIRVHILRQQGLGLQCTSWEGHRSTSDTTFSQNFEKSMLLGLSCPLGIKEYQLHPLAN